MVLALLGAMVALKFMTNTPSLTKADLGIYAILIAIADFLLIANNFGIRVALPKLLGGASPEEQARLTNATLTWQTLVSCFAGGLMLLLWALVPAPAYVATHPTWSQVHTYFWAAPALLLFSTLREILLAVHAGLQQYGMRTLGLAVYAVAQVTLVGVFVYKLQWSLGGLLAVIIATHAIAGVVLYLGLGLPRRVLFDREPWLAGVRFARPLYAGNLLNFLFNRLDTVLVGALLGPAAAGVFEIGAKKLPYLAVGVLNASMVPFLPSVSARIAKGDASGAGRLLLQTYNMFAALGYAGLLLMVLLDALLVRLFFSEAYLDGLAAMGWLMLSAMLGLQSGIFGHTLLALGKPMYIAVAGVVSALLSLSLNLILIPRFGILGAACASVVAVVPIHMLQAWWVHQNGLPIGWWPYLRPQAALAIAASAFVLVGTGTGGRVTALAVFIVMALALRVVTVSQVQNTIASVLPTRGNGRR
jgi:O-antigen/teichoic acid export membrane protein